jgi:hypothetical protein
MGYVHDTQMAAWMGPEENQALSGTWALGVNSHLWSFNRSAADATFTLKIPIKLPSNAAAQKGAYLKSIDIYWEATTAAMDDVSAALYRCNLQANGTTPTITAITTTYDAAHDTAAERLTLAAHKMTLTLAAPQWVDDDQYFFVEIAGDAAASSVFKYYGARANYTLRV